MANGIKIGSQEVYADFTSNGIYCTFRSGGLQSLATYRGEDDVVPEASGRAAGAWIADVREVALRCFIQGSGSTPEDVRESFAARFALVLAVMNPASLVTITAYPPIFGLATGDVATLADCRPMRILGPDPADLAWYEAWQGELQLTCIKSPPNWEIDLS